MKTLLLLFVVMVAGCGKQTMGDRVEELAEVYCDDRGGLETSYSGLVGGNIYADWRGFAVCEDGMQAMVYPEVREKFRCEIEDAPYRPAPTWDGLLLQDHGSGTKMMLHWENGDAAYCTEGEWRANYKYEQGINNVVIGNVFR